MLFFDFVLFMFCLDLVVCLMDLLVFKWRVWVVICVEGVCLLVIDEMVIILVDVGEEFVK